MKLHFLAIVLIAFLTISVSFAQEKSSESKEEIKREKFDPSRDAAKDIQNAITEAQKSDKRIFLDVGGEWCIWCHRLDQLFMDHKDLYKYLHENYVVVKVNYSPENKNEEVLSKYPKVAGYPHIFILNENGKLIKSKNTGELESGKGHDPKKVMTFLEKYSPANKKK